MLPYWIAFFLSAFLAFTRVRISNLGWLILASLITVFVGLRFEVGGDWYAYTAWLARSAQLSFLEVFTFQDPGYYLVNWIAASFGFEVWLVNLFSAAIFSIGLVAFVKRLPSPMLAIVIAMPYMIIVLAMGYTRQAVAFGFVLWALTYLIQNRTLPFILLLSLGAAFHKSAVILVCLAVLANTKNRAWTFVWVGLSGALLYWLFLAEQVAGLWSNYVESGYSSEGGPIRVAMNIVPALIYLLFRNRFNFAPQERALWFWMSIFSLVCLPLVFQASTAVDRVALYFMPIQLVIFASLPRLVDHNSRVIVRASVISFYALVQFVWLNYAKSAFVWLPYQFWPLANS